MTILWLILLVAFAAVEVATAQLTTIWFAVGALTALLLSAFGVESVPIQIIVFVLVSLLSLIATRPLVKKLSSKKKQPTNADRVIGEQAVVTGEIDNMNSTGEVKINGALWSARSRSGEKISEGEIVTVEAIDGVKLIVKH